MSRRICHTRTARRPKPNRYNPNDPNWVAVHAPWSKGGRLTLGYSTLELPQRFRQARAKAQASNKVMGPHH